MNATRTLVLLAALVTAGHSREIVPGIVSFEEPTGFHAFGPHHDPGDSPFNLSRTIVRYQPSDNSRAAFRQFDIGIGVVGYSFGNGKRVTYKKLSTAELKQALMDQFAQRESTALPTIREERVSGRPAYVISQQQPAPSLRKDAVFWREYYYIPFEPNRGVTLSLVADSEDKLISLRPLVKLITIPADAHFIEPPQPPPPSAEDLKRQQITKNLRVIAGAGDQSQLMYGRDKFTVAELRKDFANELAALKAVDGENYEAVVWENNKPLQISTNSLGVITYRP